MNSFSLWCQKDKPVTLHLANQHETQEAIEFASQLQPRIQFLTSADFSNWNWSELLTFLGACEMFQREVQGWTGNQPCISNSEDDHDNIDGRQTDYALEPSRLRVHEGLQAVLLATRHFPQYHWISQLLLQRLSLQLSESLRRHPKHWNSYPALPKLLSRL
uniref:Uncharacterized protein n=1 Tax=Compsopogon caeruleus TaxID=31354 RepID=A0A7S1XEB0_9RHOD|mmetsp:Transcript_4798/g.9695  ORF Transcript_4798/g.9695 Transcript_4798/m.9695 type:complete len:161 (+) Transcript_4798:920-1402(+)